MNGSTVLNAYVISSLILCANLLFLWAYSGGSRAKSKTVRNPEDTTTVAKGAAVAETDPEVVARVLRVHTNSMANIVPFLLLGNIYVGLAPSETVAIGVFGAFTAIRLIYSFVYLNGIQPWRTIMFGLGGLVTLVMMGDMVRLLVTS